MTDLTTLIACITLLVITFSVLRFLRWNVKRDEEFVKAIEGLRDLKSKYSILLAENEEFKRKAVNNDERLSDIY